MQWILLSVRESSFSVQHTVHDFNFRWAKPLSTFASYFVSGNKPL